MTCDPSIPIPHDERKWGYFITTSLAIFGAGLVLILAGRIVLYIVEKRKKHNSSVVDLDEECLYENEELEQGWYLDLKEGAGNLVSAQTLQGRILVRYRSSYSYLFS